MKYSLRTILPALLLLLMSGCIDEDRSECNPGVLLKYDYSLNPEYRNLFGDEVGKVTVYVFDEQGLYYGTYSDEGTHLTDEWQMLLPLPVGRYTTVTWAGRLGTYRLGETDAEETTFRSELTKGVTHIDNFMLNAEKDGQPLVDLDPLWHGRADVTSVYWPSEATTVDLIKDTKHLTVTVNDQTIDGTRAEGDAPYEVYCTGTNARYLADNSFGKKAAQIENRPYDTYTEPGKVVSCLNLLRLVIGREFRLIVKDGNGKEIFNRDLVEAMLVTGLFKTQEDFDREQEYEVEISMDRDVAVSVTINGWQLVEIEPGIRK